jgi:hypothetical protein
LLACIHGIAMDSQTVRERNGTTALRLLPEQLVV